MLTHRSSFILALSTWIFIMSILMRIELLTLGSLAIVFWIWLEWVWFQRTIDSVAGDWQDLRRTIADQSSARVTLVTEKTYRYTLVGFLPKTTRGYRLLLRDLLPETFEFLNGSPTLLVSASRNGRFEIQGSIRTATGGRITIPGFRVEVMDFCGLFRKEQFVSLDQAIVVLPFLIRPQTTVSVLKHNNLQQHLGHHRHRSAGISTELHGIRDYRVGDPPRTIAWKPTARLGKPMTCEFEKEVPIRATMLVDLTRSQFGGRPGPSAADRAITACAAIAKMLLADRDPIALTVLTDEGTQRIKHGSGERQLTRLLELLLACSNPNPSLDHLSIDELVHVVFENGSRRFPQLFDEAINQGPARRAFSLWYDVSNPRSRRSLALVLEHLFRKQPGYSTRLQFDDVEMRSMCNRYLGKYSLFADATTLVCGQGTFGSAVSHSAQNICQQLLNARKLSRDNELFVLIAPEPRNIDENQVVLDGVQAAIAARHRVVFVAPEVRAIQSQIRDPDAGRILAGIHGVDRSSEPSPLRDGLIRIGASFSRIDDPRMMKMVAMEVGLLQSGSSRGAALSRR